jgi:hypothetical protein
LYGCTFLQVSGVQGRANTKSSGLQASTNAHGSGFHRGTNATLRGAVRHTHTAQARQGSTNSRRRVAGQHEHTRRRVALHKRDAQRWNDAQTLLRSTQTHGCPGFARTLGPSTARRMQDALLPNVPRPC